MVDPIISYVAGIGFLVLLIVPVLYLLYIEADTEEGDEHAGESIVTGVGPVAEEGGETGGVTEAEVTDQIDLEDDDESDDVAEEDAESDDDA